MLPIIAGVKLDQLSSPTSCSERGVQALINHNLRVQAFVDTVLKGAPGYPGQMFAGERYSAIPVGPGDQSPGERSPGSYRLLFGNFRSKSL